jgi:hypothetical protein
MHLRHTTVVFLLLIVACSVDPARLALRHTTPGERRFAHSYLQLLADSSLDSAFAFLPPELRSDTARRALEGVAGILRHAQLDSIRVIGLNLNTMTGRDSWRDVNLSYEFPGVLPQWVAASVATRQRAGAITVIGFSAYPLPGPLETLNRFSFAGKSAGHYLLLILAALLPVLSIWVAVKVILARGMPRRWLWAIAALLGSPVFALNWTTGQTSFAESWFLLFCASAIKAGPAAPWIVSVAVPIGSGVSYLKLRTWRRSRASVDPIAA